MAPPFAVTLTAVRAENVRGRVWVAVTLRVVRCVVRGGWVSSHETRVALDGERRTIAGDRRYRRFMYDMCERIDTYRVAEMLFENERACIVSPRLCG